MPIMSKGKNQWQIYEKSGLVAVLDDGKQSGIPVLMTNFSKILNSLSGMFSEDRNKYLASFGEFDLLIIDDLGIERNSEYAQETAYEYRENRQDYL